MELLPFFIPFLSLLGCVFSMKMTVKRVSSELTYSKLNANVDLAFQVQIDQPTYNGVEIIFKAAKEKETATVTIFKVTFNNQGAPIYQKDLDEDYKGRVEPKFQDSRLTVLIQNLMSTDFNMEYTCLATTDKDKWLKPSNNTILKEAVAPKINVNNILFQSDKDYEVRPLNKYTEFICQVEETIPTPTMKWVKVENGEVIKTMITGVTSKVVLEFESFKETDMGKYRCIAENVGGEDAQEFNLQAGYIKLLEGSKASETMELNIGEPVQKLCPIVGYPFVKNIEWMTWNSTARNYTIINSSQQFYYTIRDESDFRTYTCEASNNYGVVTYNLTVKNAGGVVPETEQQKQGNSSAINYGSSLVLVSTLHFLVVLLL